MVTSATNHPAQPGQPVRGSGRRAMFDRVLGTNVIRLRFVKHMLYGDIREYLEKDVEGFRRLSKQYWLYK